jgi:hypothetical protein
MKDLTTPNHHAFEDNRPTVIAKPREHLDQGSAAEDFQRIMLETVDETFSSLGKKAKQSIYFRLKNSFGTTRENIPTEIEKFATAIEKIFGPAAQLLEIQIMKRLHKKIGARIKYYPKQKNLTFVDYLETTRILLSVCTSAERPMPDEYYNYKFC